MFTILFMGWVGGRHGITLKRNSCNGRPDSISPRGLLQNCRAQPPEATSRLLLAIYVTGKHHRPTFAKKHRKKCIENWRVAVVNEEVLERLDILIKLQAAALTATMESSKDKILFLSNAGVRPTLIANILGTTTNSVNVTLSKSRKPAKSR
jgi:hypothetical protein